MRVVVTDSAGRSATASRTVDVVNPVPAAAITSPSPGATLSGQVNVTYALSPAPPWDWYQVDLLVDDTSWASWTDSPGAPLPLDTSQFAPGAHTIRIRAWNPRGEVLSTRRSVVFA